MARICFDVDGLICDDRDDVPYAHREPYAEFIERLWQLKEDGHEIILQTARYMSKHSPKQADKLGRKELIDWLEFHKIPCDELYFGKPSADVYVDDKGFRLRSNDGVGGWDGLMNFVANGLSPDLDDVAPGDVVELKSGSPPMTVESVAGKEARVVFYDYSDNMCKTDVKLNTLVKTDKRNRPHIDEDDDDEDDDYDSDPEDSDIDDSDLESGAS